MATINFMYRSVKDHAPLNLRLLFTHNGKAHVYGAKTKFIVSKNYWENYHNKNVRDAKIKNEKLEVYKEINKIESHILKEFNQTNPSLVDKKWLTYQIKNYYIEDIPSDSLTDKIIPYFDKYYEFKEMEMKKETIKKYKTVQNLLSTFEDTLPYSLLVKDIDLHFKKNFETHLLNNQYSPNTISKALGVIKTICNHARINGIKTSPQLELIKPKFTKTEKLYLNFSEIQAIEEINKEKLNDRLENARDWLIISCFTGQRISDFMNFRKNLIREENGKKLIEFTQKKTNKNMTVPLHEKVQTILNKREGEFPRPLSHQKYNDYIKEVCQLAEISQMTKGALMQEIEEDSSKYRRVSGMYQKWELVSSHIGRRSFATNFYGKIPTTYLIYITGHSTERMFLQYIGKSNKDLALEITNYF